FRTCYPVTLWPIEVASASMDPVSARSKSSAMMIRIGLRGLNDTPLSQLKMSIAEHQRPIDRLRFYIHGDAQLVYPLYECLFNNATQVELRPSGASPALPTITLPPSSLKAVGFEPDEGMLPYTARSFTGYRLLTEYFAFPEKFLFFDVTGLDAAARAGFG